MHVNSIGYAFHMSKGISTPWKLGEPLLCMHASKRSCKFKGVIQHRRSWHIAISYQQPALKCNKYLPFCVHLNITNQKVPLAPADLGTRCRPLASVTCQTADPLLTPPGTLYSPLTPPLLLPHTILHSQTKTQPLLTTMFSRKAIAESV